ITVEERVNLSAYLIRLRQYEQAVEILTPVAFRDQRNFMVFANLATAHQHAGRLDRARGYLEQMQDVWPGDWPNLSNAQLDWYRRAESYHLKLVRLRYRESLAAAGGRTKGYENLDDLFASEAGPVHFI